jgi:GTP-binding protein Era
VGRAVTRAGFVALAGRPNAGKSTLVNSLVGSKVAIVSDKPQTTRRAIRGVATRPGEWQLVLVDLPGVQRPRDALTERMQRRVESELSDADTALMVIDGFARTGAGDRFIAAALARSGLPVTIALNKIDRLNRGRTVEALQLAADLGLVDAEVFPVSAKTGKGVAALADHLAQLVPESPFLFELGSLSDQPLHTELAELIREQLLRRTRQEVPHAIEVQVDEIEPLREGLTRIIAYVWVETESQKGIVIGAGGRMIRDVGAGARKQLEKKLGEQVHLDLSVRVRRHWREDDSLLNRLGIE